MTHLFYIMRAEFPRYLQGFTGDGYTWHTGARWVDHRAFAMSVHDFLLTQTLDGIADVAGISLHPTTMAEQSALLDEWVKQFKQL